MPPLRPIPANNVSQMRILPNRRLFRASSCSFLPVVPGEGCVAAERVPSAEDTRQRRPGSCDPLRGRRMTGWVRAQDDGMGAVNDRDSPRLCNLPRLPPPRLPGSSKFQPFWALGAPKLRNFDDPEDVTLELRRPWEVAAVSPGGRSPPACVRAASRPGSSAPPGTRSSHAEA